MDNTFLKSSDDKPMDLGSLFLSYVKYYSDYAKANPMKNRPETWVESVTDVMNMHREKYAHIKSDELKGYIDFAENMYKQKRVLASQRNLQFRGEQVKKHNSRLYNCSVTYVDRARAFSEIMYQLMCGCGVGYSVQYKNINKLPSIAKRGNDIVEYIIRDEIEGWADAIGVLMSSYFTSDQQFPEYFGKKIMFNYDRIRPRGAYISGGYKAPGADGLRDSIQKIEKLFERQLNEGASRLRSIDVHDIICHSSDAVLSGGVRRSALISIFDLEDEDMLSAKIGNWFIDNPQRGRANNSALILRNHHTKDQFLKLLKMTEQFGEPGIFFAESDDIITNPCAEIGFVPIDDTTGETGWSMCNLTEINASLARTKEDFFKACMAASIIGTLQAGYTDFKYLTDVSKRIIEKEALLGVSITGWMSNPSLFDKELLKEGARIVKETNEKVAKLIGINKAARTTCVKPSGNASVLLGTTSGIHGEHARQYFRIMQYTKNSEIAKYLEKYMPEMLENSVWSKTGTDYAIYVPVVANENAIFKSELYDEKLLNYVKFVQQYWVEEGTNVENCIRPYIRHNVSNTVDVKNWDVIAEEIWENRHIYGGLSFLPALGGDKIYQQAPFTAVLNMQEIVDKYGDGALFASGLIVDAQHRFNNLWTATDMLKDENIPLTGSTDEVLLMKDWIRRAKKFAKNYFSYDLNLMVECLKDVHLYHKWTKINKVFKPVDFEAIFKKEKEDIDIDTLGAVACSGGACEVTF